MFALIFSSNFSYQIERDIPAENGTLDGCIWLTEEQAEQMLEDTVMKLEERMH